MGCGGTSVDGTSAPQAPAEELGRPAGKLTVAVTDIEGRSLPDALIDIYGSTTTSFSARALTGTNGLATFASLPPVVDVWVRHGFGETYLHTVSVPQTGNAFLTVTLPAHRPSPTVALLPVSIPPGSISADRSELTLQVTLVASALRPFLYADGVSISPPGPPTLGFEVWRSDPGVNGEGGLEKGVCRVWRDPSTADSSCGTPVGESLYTVSVLEFSHAAAGTIPLLAAPGPAQSAMLVMDQSGRVPALDAHFRRSFAARQFIARELGLRQPKSLSIAGLAGDGMAAATTALLPELPLWLPLGAGAAFSTDRPTLEAAVGMLEPLTGGSAPVFEALRAAFTLTAAEAPPGNRAVVAFLGGGDDTEMSESTRQEALAALRRQRDDAGIQAILIAGAPFEQPDERQELAELSAALRAPAISLGEPATWTSGSFAALDLAADLMDGLPLPTLSAVFRVKANAPGAFPAGTTLHGMLYLESTNFCDWGCRELPVEFAVEIP